MKTLPDSSYKLRPKHEIFAQQRASGRTLADSYADAYEKRSTATNNNTLRVCGKRLADRPEIIARIDHIVSEQRTRQEAETAEIEIPENLTRSDILEIVFETTTVLESAYDALVKTGLPEIRKRQFYATLSSHLNRQSKMIEEGAVIAPDDGPVTKMIDRLHDKFRGCVCQN